MMKKAHIRDLNALSSLRYKEDGTVTHVGSTPLLKTGPQGREGRQGEDQYSPLNSLGFRPSRLHLHRKGTAYELMYVSYILIYYFVFLT